MTKVKNKGTSSFQNNKMFFKFNNILFLLNRNEEPPAVDSFEQECLVTDYFTGPLSKPSGPHPVGCKPVKFGLLPTPSGPNPLRSRSSSVAAVSAHHSVPSDPSRGQRSGFDAFEDTRSQLRLLSRSQPTSTEYDLEQIRNCFPELFDAGSNDELRKQMCSIPLAVVDQTNTFGRR